MLFKNKLFIHNNSKVSKNLSLKENSFEKKFYYETLTDDNKSKVVVFYLNNIFVVQNIKCSWANCHLPNGICASIKECLCRKEYAELSEDRNYLPLDDSNKNKFSQHIQDSYCNYIRKKQFFAFGLEIFSFGIGHFYCQRMFHGLFKFSLEIIIILLYYLMKLNRIEIVFKKSPVNVLYTFFCCVFFFFHCYDMISFSLNVYEDGNGVPLISWNTDDEIYIHKY
jgi:hypothetical protein